MKIGIVTFQRTTNFGAIMQCYALNKKIRNLGAECETIDYHNKKINLIKKYIISGKNLTAINLLILIKIQT